MFCVSWGVGRGVAGRLQVMQWTLKQVSVKKEEEEEEERKKERKCTLRVCVYVSHTGIAVDMVMIFVI